MAIPKRGSRRIVVDDVVYRWRMRRRPTADQRSGRTPLLVAVAAEEAQGPTMVARLHRAHPGNERAHYTEAVTPAEVARLIREGQRLGWEPLRPGPQFTLEPLCSGAPQGAAAPPRIFPPGLRPPGRQELLALARERPPAERDVLRFAARPYISWPGGGGYQPGGVEVSGVDLIELVRAAELPHAEREVSEMSEMSEMSESGESTQRVPADRAGAYLGLPLASLRGRALFDRPISDARHFSLPADDPRLGKATILGCTCGITECWFLLMSITIGEEVVIWSDFEQFHRPWIYDLGPFFFDKRDYLAALELAP